MKNKFFSKIRIIIPAIVVSGLLIIGLIIGCRIYSEKIAMNQTVLYINDTPVCRLEYEYYYNSYYYSYMDSYAFAIPYIIDTDEDIMNQIYEGDKTYAEYFDECAVQMLIKITALCEDGKAKGFSYDTDDDYNAFIDQVSQSCANAKVSDDKYFEKYYGKYAKRDNTEKFFRDGFYAEAYYEYLCETMNDSENDYEAFDYVADLKEKYEIKYEE